MFMQMKSNFEQSLRTRIYPVTPTANGNNPGLNPDFHRGCTGKAHACGTVKSRLNRTNSNNNNNHTNATTTSSSSGSVANSTGSTDKKLVQRKNSISSETISDSGSENSAPSWLDATDCVVRSGSNSSIASKIPEAKKRMLQLRKQNLLKNMPTLGNSGKLLPTSSNVARKSPIPISIATVANRRRRLHSEGDRMSETGATNASTTKATMQQQQQQQQQQREATFERIQKYRSFRVGSNNKTNSLRKTINSTTASPITLANANANIAVNIIRPPWNSGSAVKVTVTTASATFNTRNYRNSFRRRDAVDWSAIWERSLALRGCGANSGLYRNYGEAIKRKVCKSLIYTQMLDKLKAKGEKKIT